MVAKLIVQLDLNGHDAESHALFLRQGGTHPRPRDELERRPIRHPEQEGLAVGVPAAGGWDGRGFDPRPPFARQGLGWKRDLLGCSFL